MNSGGMSAFVGPIKEVAHGIYDGPHATPPGADSGPVFLGIKNVTANGRLDLSEIRHVSEEHYPRWARRVTPQANDIVFSYEATLHRYALIPEGFRGCLGRRMALIRPNTEKVVPRFLHYYFLCNAWRSVVESNVISGATVDRIPLTRFPDFEVRLPDIETQTRIASILSAYDDLIENNRRRIRLLEQAARLLYKEWFVHLRFPGHEHVKIKDGVPEGWEKRTVGNVSSFISRGITPKYDEEAPGTVLNQKCIRNQRLDMGLARNQSKTVPPSKLVRFGDVLINSTGQGTLGRAAQFLDSIENCTVDSHITIARPDMGVPILLFGQCIASMENFLGTRGRGATNQTELAKATVAALPFLNPHALLAKKFERIVDSIAKYIQNLMRQNGQLDKARNMLLPRLMNGEVIV